MVLIRKFLIVFCVTCFHNDNHKDHKDRDNHEELEESSVAGTEEEPKVGEEQGHT